MMATLFYGADPEQMKEITFFADKSNEADADNEVKRQLESLGFESEQRRRNTKADKFKKALLGEK